MKNSVVVICILLVIFFLNSLVSCDSGRIDSEKFQIVNLSDHLVEISSYRFTSPDQELRELEGKNNIVLNSQNSVWESDKIKITRGGTGFYYLGDTITVDFDKDKRVAYVYDDKSPPRHFYNFDDNYMKEVRDNTTIYTYTFTNEDYENAEQIDE